MKAVPAGVEPPGSPGSITVTWAVVRDAPRLVRAEILRADGRRITIYRQRDATRS